MECLNIWTYWRCPNNKIPAFWTPIYRVIISPLNGLVSTAVIVCWSHFLFCFCYFRLARDFFWKKEKKGYVKSQKLLFFVFFWFFVCFFVGLFLIFFPKKQTPPPMFLLNILRSALQWISSKLPKNINNV